MPDAEPCASRVLIPSDRGGFTRCLGELHRRYTAAINAREGWRGYLWQGRCASSVLDETHFLAALRYVVLNPVQAPLVAAPADWRWSNARFHLLGQPDGLTDAAAVAGLIDDWAAFLAAPAGSSVEETLRCGERTVRPSGNPIFVRALEEQLVDVCDPAGRGRERRRRLQGREVNFVSCPQD